MLILLQILLWQPFGIDTMNCKIYKNYNQKFEIDESIFIFRKSLTQPIEAIKDTENVSEDQEKSSDDICNETMESKIYNVTAKDDGLTWGKLLTN